MPIRPRFMNQLRPSWNPNKPAVLSGRWATVAVCLGIIILVSAFGFYDFGSIAEDDAWIAYVAILAAVGVLLVLGIYWLKGFDKVSPALLHPPALVTAWFIVAIGLPGLAGFLYPDCLEELEVLVGVHYAYAAWGMGLMLVGLFCLWIGYAVGWRLTPYLAPLEKLGDFEPSRLVVIHFYLLTIVARLARVVMTGIAYGADRAGWGETVGLFDQWIGYVESARFLVLAIVCIQVLRRSWPRSLLLGVLGLETVFAFTSGFMKPLLWVVLVTGLSALYMRVNLKRYAPFVLIFAVLGIMIVPVTSELRRNSGRFNLQSPVEILNATTEALGTTWGSGIDVGLDMFLTKALSRESGVAFMPGLIMMQTPSAIPYQGADGFLAIVTYIIPRAIWENKPVIQRGLWFSHTYLNVPEEVETSTAMTIFGECYIFSGWAGTIFGLFGLGILLACLFRNTTGAGLAPLYIALVPSFLDIEGEFTAMIVAIFQSSLVFLFFYWVLMRRSQRAERQARRLPKGILGITGRA